MKKDQMRPDVKNAWVKYKQTGNKESRNLLIINYQPLVIYHSKRIHERLPSRVDIGDLQGEGQFGLFQAIDNFDLSRGIKFESYSSPRIRGAMLDYLRRSDWVPRLVRERTAKVKKAREKSEKATGKRQTEEELSGEMNVGDKEFRKIIRDYLKHSEVSLNDVAEINSTGKKQREAIDFVCDTSAEDPLEIQSRISLRDYITQGLSRNERLIILMRYYGGLTMGEIGRALDVSESRISQMHSFTIRKLKSIVPPKLSVLEEELLIAG